MMKHFYLLYLALRVLSNGMMCTTLTSELIKSDGKIISDIEQFLERKSKQIEERIEQRFESTIKDLKQEVDELKNSEKTLRTEVERLKLQLLHERYNYSIQGTLHNRRGRINKPIFTCIVVQIGHIVCGNFNIHSWACSCDCIVTNR